ncbi:putative beta-lactamase HcpC precursor [compost metagenome]
MSSHAIIRSVVLSVVVGIFSGCATTLPPELAFAPQTPPSFWAPDSQADPGVWGVYARLVGHKFAPPTSGFPGYEFKWSKPGQEIQEIFAYHYGEMVVGDKERYRRVIRLGAKPGTLISTKDGKDWIGTIESDGSVYFTRPNDWSYRLRLNSKGELRNEPVDVTSEGKLAAVYDTSPYPVVAGPALDAITTAPQSQPQVAAAAQKVVAADKVRNPALSMLPTSKPTPTEQPLAALAVAPAGDSEAEYQQGLRFYKGNGVPENNVEAANWFRKAAEKGHPAAQVSLGNLYRDGVGVQKSYSETVNWYRKSADQGFAKGERSLGYMYDKGLGVTEDNALAADWYRKAALKDDAPAQTFLGILYEEGDGVPQSYDEAESWYMKAVYNGDDNAPAYLNNLRMKMENLYAEEDYEEPAPSGGQIFMNAMNTFAQEYNGAMAEQARSQALIQQTYARAQVEKDRHEAAQERRRQAEARIAQKEARAAEERQASEQAAQHTSQSSAPSTLEAQQDATVAAALAQARQLAIDAGADAETFAKLDLAQQEMDKRTAAKAAGKQQAGTNKLYASKITLNTATNSMVPSNSTLEPAKAESNMAAGKVRLCNRPGDEGPAHWPMCPEYSKKVTEPGSTLVSSSSKDSDKTATTDYTSKPGGSSDQTDDGRTWSKEPATAWCMLSQYGNFKCWGPNGKAWSGTKTIKEALSNAGCTKGVGRTPSMGEMNFFDCDRLRQATDGKVPTNRPAPW